jgi:hypothetical protein
MSVTCETFYMARRTVTMGDENLLQLVSSPKEASRVRLSSDEARSVSREMVEAGFVDTHVLQLMEVWGIPTATLDPEKMSEARDRTEKFLERVAMRITQEEESFLPEVKMDDAD